MCGIAIEEVFGDKDKFERLHHSILHLDEIPDVQPLPGKAEFHDLAPMPRKFWALEHAAGSP